MPARDRSPDAERGVALTARELRRSLQREIELERWLRRVRAEVPSIRLDELTETLLGIHLCPTSAWA